MVQESAQQSAACPPWRVSSQQTYTFDAAGNRLSLIKIVGDTTNVTAYAYDALNRLRTNATASATTTYALQTGAIRETGRKAT